MGSTMLAQKTTRASSQEPVSHSTTTPLMMVSCWVPKGERVSMMGSRLAGR